MQLTRHIFSPSGRIFPTREPKLDIRRKRANYKVKVSRILDSEIFAYCDFICYLCAFYIEYINKLHI